MQPNPKPEALLRSIDSLIEVHARGNPELLHGLQQLRNEVLGTVQELRKLQERSDEAQKAAQSRLWRDLALAALRLATWIKFIFDHLPPPD